MKKTVAVALLSVCLAGLLFAAAPSEAAQGFCAQCRWIPFTGPSKCDYGVAGGGVECLFTGTQCFTIGECSTGLTVTR